MSDDPLQDQIDATVAAAIERLRDEIAPAIAEGIRIQSVRPASERGSVSIQYGEVVGVFTDYITVLLDGQTDPVPADTLGTLTIGDRTAVFFIPPSGTLAIGSGSGSVPPPASTVQTEFLYYVDSPGGHVSTPQWLVDVGGDTVVDLTTPANPLVLVDGLYIVTVGVRPTSSTGVGSGHLFAPSSGRFSPASGRAQAQSFNVENGIADGASITLSRHLTAGDSLAGWFADYQTTTSLDLLWLACITQVT